ncbi:uncharacterized protein LOC128616618 [Ictalurus furcatus]|uniref:uncharacterized protein LOC128616618 n=1 Tax=Ictalurus furcatus TaxID=66913 RepID=UPI002350C2BD|nr:uncharacterized protein LOC128616618 [Ictalurus furcatus]
MPRLSREVAGEHLVGRRSDYSPQYKSVQCPQRMAAELPLETYGWGSHPLLFLFHSQVYFASLAAQWLGFLVSRFYGPAWDWAEQLARSGSSALYDVTQFSELFLKELLQPGQSNSLDVLERGIEVMDREDWPFHLHYTWLDRIEAAASLQVPVDAVELQPEVNIATSGLPSEVNMAASDLQLETYGEVSAVELQPEVNRATSGPPLEVNPVTSELRPEAYGEVSAVELPLEVNPAEEAVQPATSELQPETYGEVSSAEEAVPLPGPAEDSVPLPCPAEEAVTLSCPAEDVPLPSCTAEYTVLFTWAEEDVSLLSCFAEEVN